MRLNDVDDLAVQSAVADLPEQFRTKHVSRQAGMVDAHAGGGDTNYHAVIGKYLRAHDAALGVRLVAETHGDLGATWEKTSPASRTSSRAPLAEPTRTPHQSEAAPTRIGGVDKAAPVRANSVARPRPGTQGAPGDGLDLGPQSASDNPFTARMRLHQSWYRAHVLGVPCGVGPQRSSASHYGNMLREADGARGLNFLTPRIHQTALRRLGENTGVVEPFRLLHNMLSSQPMCFNLFAPLTDDLGLATRLVGALLPGEVARVRSVNIEWAPLPPADYLNDRTAFDAFVTYERPDGRLAFLGIETKLTEPFSKGDDDGASYRRWMHLPASPWTPEGSGDVAQSGHNQLWRDHLLAWALLQKQPDRFAVGRLMLVRHPGDRNCERIVGRYQSLLNRNDETFMDMPLDRLVDRWRAEVPESPWLDEVQRRYLALELSSSV